MRDLDFYGDNPVRPDGKHRYPDYRETRKGTACCVCGARPCLRVVGTKGFCGDHVAEAFAAAKQQMRSV